jgi:hypothetical protein
VTSDRGAWRTYREERKPREPTPDDPCAACGSTSAERIVDRVGDAVASFSVARCRWPGPCVERYRAAELAAA